MDIIVKRSALDSCEKVFERSLCLEEAAESVVPDTQPDAEYILCAGGAAFIRSKDVNAGRVGLSAQAEVTALYAAEGSGGICALSAVVPINVELEAPEVTPESVKAEMMSRLAEMGVQADTREGSYTDLLLSEAGKSVSCTRRRPRSFQSSSEATNRLTYRSLPVWL